jgi:hypothetical protein
MNLHAAPQHGLAIVAKREIIVALDDTFAEPGIGGGLLGASGRWDHRQNECQDRGHTPHSDLD